MKLGNLHMIIRSVEERRKLLALVSAKRLAVQLSDSVTSTTLDDTYSELVRPIIHGEIRARIRRIEADLVGMGVDLD